MLATDDQGILRTDMTKEYIIAIKEFNLSYKDIITLAYTSIESSFLSPLDKLRLIKKLDIEIEKFELAHNN